MLRRNEKERNNTKTDDLKKLETENRELVDKLNREIGDRKKEIEFWVQERATMREMIDQLENDKVEGVLAVGTNEAEGKQDDSKASLAAQKKLAKKLKQKDFDLKTKERELQGLKDEMNQMR